MPARRIQLPPRPTPDITTSGRQAHRALRNLARRGGRGSRMARGIVTGPVNLNFDIRDTHGQSGR